MKIHATPYHEEITEWKSDLAFYKDELKIFSERLGQVSLVNKDAELKKKVSHFENQLIIQKEQLDVLHHQLVVADDKLAEDQQAHPVASDHRLYPFDEKLKLDITTYIKLYSEFKTEFEAFLVEAL